MLKFFSFRVKIFFLTAIIAFGIYIYISIPASAKMPGSVIQQDGLIINNITGQPFTGRVIDTVSSQIVNYEVKEGIKNGEFTITLLNGNKAVKGEIINNKNEGKWRYYYPGGQIESEGYFKNDVVVDKWTWYYPNGSKMEEGIFVDGKREGLWKTYRQDGSLKSTLFFQKGDQISSYDTNSPAV